MNKNDPNDNHDELQHNPIANAVNEQSNLGAGNSNNIGSPDELGFGEMMKLEGKKPKGGGFKAIAAVVGLSVIGLLGGGAYKVLKGGWGVHISQIDPSMPTPVVPPLQELQPIRVTADQSLLDEIKHKLIYPLAGKRISAGFQKLRGGRTATRWDDDFQTTIYGPGGELIYIGVEGYHDEQDQLDFRISRMTVKMDYTLPPGTTAIDVTEPGTDAHDLLSHMNALDIAIDNFPHSTDKGDFKRELQALLHGIVKDQLNQFPADEQLGAIAHRMLHPHIDITPREAFQLMEYYGKDIIDDAANDLKDGVANSIRRKIGVSPGSGVDNLLNNAQLFIDALHCLEQVREVGIKNMEKDKIIVHLGDRDLDGTMKGTMVMSILPNGNIRIQEVKPRNETNDVPAKEMQ